MITVNNMTADHDTEVAEFELKGLHTDSKPTAEFNGKKVGTNSLFFELDTGDLYYFTGSAWTKVGG